VTAARKSASRGHGIAVRSITPFLWFNDQAEEAAKFYTSIFRNSKIVEMRRFEPKGKGRKGKAMSVSFTLGGRSFHALNGGPAYSLTPAFSLFVECVTQSEVDYLWKKLTRGGRESRCGWLEDKFGLSWQIIPNRLMELLGDEDEERAGRALAAMLKMRKIDLLALEKACGPSKSARMPWKPLGSK
jgi:predicted 3-demethylubiquinone-9 3-methyltransferase (glyoxalase superfamily)